MQRDVGDIADHPTIVPGRAGRNVEECAGTKFVDGAVFHSGSGASGEHQANVLHIASRGAYGRSDMNGPLPFWLIGSATDSQAPDVDKLKFSFFECAYFVGFFKTASSMEITPL